MEITNKTKLKDLLAEYPWLKEELIKINDKFKLLHTPLAKVMLGKADLSMMSEKAEMEVDVFIEKLKELIASHN
ncbi:hypothetical protein HMPREF1987_00347 [Peptostreptococcaceae bacterium oral taxon 113 str. W5053]|nr:hypothetical protein HMPREF1987_00347 [Peptostreptococcaceae bacterium oral taxon 113 str. W5053]